MLIMATFIEAKPFIDLMPFTQVHQAPFPSFRHENKILVISGMGKVNAAMAATFGCLTYRPDSVLNLGAAGATGFSISLGEIFQIGKAVEADGFDFNTRTAPVYTPEILPGFQTETIATRDIPVLKKNHRNSASLSAALVDMESSAIVRVCQKFQTRCHLFKFVTDTPDHPCEGHIKKHIRQYRLAFYQFIAESVLPVL